MFISLVAPVLAKVLPHYLDASEKVDLSYVPVQNLLQVPPAGFRPIAEYEPVDAVVVAWPGYDQMATEIAKAAAWYNTSVWVVGQPPASIPGVPERFLKKKSVPINTPWIRDYGPQGIAFGDKIGFVDSLYSRYQTRTKDDQVPAALGKLSNVPVYDAPILQDGGNWLIDTYGNMYISKVIYWWNKNFTPAELDKKMKEYWGVKNIYSFEYSGYPNDPLDRTGHIDMFMKLLNDDTVIISVGEVQPFKKVGEQAVKFFTDRTAPNGKKYTVLTVPGYWVNNKVWYTWSNSLIFNNVLLLPTYKDYPTQNQRAKEIYEKIGFKVIGINSDAAIVNAGAIHCITQSIPRSRKPIKSQ